MAKVLLFLAGLFALAALAWMALLPWAVERQLSSMTGFDVRVTSLAANPFTGRVDVEGFTIHNPADYPEPQFVEVRHLRADLNEFSLLMDDRLLVNEFDLDTAKVELVLQGGGRSNANAFAAAFSHGAGPSGAGGTPAPASKPHRYLIQKLHLRVDQLVVADFSSGSRQEKAYELRIDHTFTNVTSPTQLLVPDVLRSLTSFGASRDVARLIPGDFGRALGDAVGSAAQVGAKLKDAEKKAKDYFKGLLDKLDH